MNEIFINTLKNEWNALASAPWSFILLTVLAFSSAYTVCRWAYQQQLDTRKEKFDLLNERLIAKDEQLDEYRERLGLMPSSGSKFAKLSHKELQDYTLKFVAGIRDWFAASESETRRIAEQQWNAMARAQTEDQKHQLWEAHSSTHTNGLFTLMREFDQKYKVDAILIRDELQARLPASERDRQVERRYEHPTNTFCIRNIADDLERKAKLLR